MDTLVHICVSHMDLGKIYALVEQMVKTDYPGHKKPFDMRNRNNETPLFLAIEKRNNAVVDYLLEAGADPNTQNCKIDRDGPLHLAARLGMAEIVKTICSYSSTNLNATNGKGLTPLLCAVMNHGVYEEDGGYICDNTQIIRYLLKFGADPLIAVSFLQNNLLDSIPNYRMQQMAEQQCTWLVEVCFENARKAML